MRLPTYLNVIFLILIQVYYLVRGNIIASKTFLSRIAAFILASQEVLSLCKMEVMFFIPLDIYCAIEPLFSVLCQELGL